MITVEHLTKRYGDVTAVEDISFTIEDGHIYGFLGPNGAGKSTTMNIMTGCLAATSGEVKIDGYDIFEQARQAKPSSSSATCPRSRRSTPTKHRRNTCVLWPRPKACPSGPLPPRLPGSWRKPV